MTWKIPASVPASDKKLRTQITQEYAFKTLSCITFILAFISVTHVIVPFLASRLGARSIKARPKLTFIYNWTSGHEFNVVMTAVVACLIYSVGTDLHQDIMYLAKRLGRVATALMPPIYFLSLKPSPLPNTFYLELLPLHKWISRIMILLVVAHTITYTYAYIKTGKLFKLLHFSNLAGIAAFLAFVIVFITSLPAIRRRFYHLFFGIHIITAYTSLILIWYHASPKCPEYMIPCGLLVAWQLSYRIYQSTTLKLPVQFISPTLLLISIPKSKLPARFRSYQPGSHVRISGPFWWPSTWLEASHPYTIASLDYEDNFQLLIRKSNYRIKLRQRYSMVGPFKSLGNHFLYNANNNQIRRALFVVGGSGVAYAAPIFRYLKSRGVECKLLWAIRDPQDARAIKPLKLDQAAVNGELEIYFSRKLRANKNGYRSPAALGYSDGSEDESNKPDTPILNRQLTRPNKAYKVNEEDLSLAVNDSCGMEEENQPLLSHRMSTRSLRQARFMENVLKNEIFNEYAPVMYNNRPVLNLRIKSWLCGLSTGDDDCCCVDQLLTVRDSDKNGSYVISAGSHRLVNDAKKWTLENGFQFHAEEYTL